VIEPRNTETYANTATLAGLAASVLALLVPLVIGTLRPDYSQVRHYISELGERGAPYAGWVNWAGFLPTGLLVLVFLSVINGRLPADGKSLLLFSAVGWGYVISPLCPCDPGCPYWGSASQLVHNLAAIVVYPATTAGLALMAIAFRSDRHWRKWWVFTMVCSILVAVGFAAMLVPDGEPWRGLTQRVAETAIFGWIAVTGLAMKRMRR